MSDPDYIKKTVSRWFKEDKELLSDVHFGQEIILTIATLSERKESIGRYIVEKSGLTKAAVYRKIRRLSEDGLISQDTGAMFHDRIKGKEVRDGRVRPYYLTEKGRMIAEFLKAFPLPQPRSPTRRFLAFPKPSTYAREFHSARLRELIERILAQLPDVHDANIYFPPIGHLAQGLPIEIRPKQVYHGLRLPFEKEVLLDDLKNHPDFNEFRRFFKEFKRLCEEFEQRRDEALRGIEKDVSKHFNLQYSPHWEEPDSFNWRMRGWVFEGGIQSIGVDRKRYFEPYYVNLKSHMEEETVDGHKLLQYWIGGTGFIQTGRGNHEKDVFQKKIDDELSNYMRKIEKAPYYSDIKTAQRLLERARDLRGKIELTLKRNLEVPIFRGDCEYLRAME